jgi:hypothetical protein
MIFLFRLFVVVTFGITSTCSEELAPPPVFEATGVTVTEDEASLYIEKIEEFYKYFK